MQIRISIKLTFLIFISIGRSIDSIIYRIHGTIYPQADPENER